MKQCNYSAVQIPAMYAYAMLSLILVPILHISTVHEYPSWIYGLFTTAWSRAKAHFLSSWVIWWQIFRLLFCASLATKMKKKIEAVCDLIHIYNQFMHSGQSYVHNHAIMHCRSSKSGEGNLSAPPLPLRSHFLAVFLPHRQIYICTSQSVRVCKLQLFLFSSVDRRGLFTHGKMPLPPCVINWGYLKY